MNRAFTHSASPAMPFTLFLRKSISIKAPSGWLLKINILIFYPSCGKK